MASPSITPVYGNHHHHTSGGISSVTPSSAYSVSSTGSGPGTNERSRNRSRISRLSHSQRKN